MGNAGCKETVLEAENNIESGVGELGGLLVYQWKGNFLIGFVHVRHVVFQISGNLKVSTFHEPCLGVPVVVS